MSLVKLDSLEVRSIFLVWKTRQLVVSHGCISEYVLPGKSCHWFVRDVDLKRIVPDMTLNNMTLTLIAQPFQNVAALRQVNATAHFKG